jgi:hypothetical protein
VISQLNKNEFEIPFRSLLRSMNHFTIFHKTYNGSGEHGKDVISFWEKNNKQTVYFFLIKTKDISTKRFRTEVRPELTTLIEVPFVNELIKKGAKIKYFFVSTGSLSREAFNEFEAFNNQNLKNGHPEVKLWNKSKLVTLFFENLKSSFMFSSIIDDFTRYLLNVKSAKYKRLEWSTFIDKILANRNNQGQLPGLGLATVLFFFQAYLNNQKFVAFDIFKISLVKMWQTFSRSGNYDLGFFDQFHREYIIMLERFVKELENKLLGNQGLFDETKGVLEAILYPIRTFSVLGIISYLSYFWRLNENKAKQEEYLRLIKSVIIKNPSSLIPPVDFFRKDIAITLLELCKNNNESFATEWISRLFYNINQRFIKNGWWPVDSNKLKEIIEHTFGFTEKNTPSSYLLTMLFRFCAKINKKEIYNKYRVVFEEFKLFEYLPPKNTKRAELEFLNGRLVSGSTILKALPSDFSRFSIQTANIKMKKYTPIKNNRPYILQLISDVHGDYVFPEIYLDF